MMDFYITLTEEQFEKVKNLDTSLGIWFWNIAVMCNPYDTGNSRRAITLTANTSKKINIRYNLMQANYIKFLEEGVGPVKAYKGYISNWTRIAIVEELIHYLKTGATVAALAPVVQLRSSRNVFHQERRYLAQADMHTNAITARARNQISKIRETAYRQTNNIPLTSFTGQKVITENIKVPGIRGSVRGMSALHQAYSQIKMLK